MDMQTRGEVKRNGFVFSIAIGSIQDLGATKTVMRGYSVLREDSIAANEQKLSGKVQTDLTRRVL